MPSFTTVLEDTSPMLLYAGSWRAGHSSDDKSAELYTQSSFTVTQVKGDSMSFNFYGTSVGVFGARRGNHGGYIVQFDGNPFQQFDGQSTSDEFNQALFTSTVDLGTHKFTISNNDDSRFLDIDYIVFLTDIGQDNETLIVNSYQDIHPAFTYTPPSSWTTPDAVGTFSGGSGHHIYIPRDAVALYGPVGPNQTASYSVQVDDGNASFFNATKEFYRPQQILFYAGNLGRGTHELHLRQVLTAAGEFAIDYANVYTAPSLGGR
ncbi:hypothetical protein GALMADRAFT_211337 [Galerina marginata CBS 339.88]|uniref:Uncharacterized protein n=1 Tax=Galerina marginata (strain CBS 339.88) TaxID=685588 RepID=A0A067SVV3_GALM3|nr:hypothetical protein GALMADRAFT_211337 [Galerina marginata CBS 339.88]